MQSSIATHRAIRLFTDTAIGAGLVAATTALLIVTAADLTFASILLLLVVVGASVVSYTAGVVAAVAAAASLAYYFTPPVHSFAIDQPDDVLALVAFVAASVVVGLTIARLTELRRRSDLAAREAQLRLVLTNDLATGVAPADVLKVLTAELVDLFDLAACEIAFDGTRARAASARPSIDSLHMSTNGLALDLALGRAFRAGERETIEALAAGLATAIDRDRLDRAAREQRTQADLDHSRAAFLTAVTHDLRTPIATIKTATGALLAPRSTFDERDRVELLEAAHEESARLETLVTKVLELTRIRTGIRPERSGVAAADLVQAAVDRLGPLANRRTILLDIDPDLPALLVDPLLMEHVVMNLLENAIRHDPTGADIVVWARVDGAALQVGVADHGAGIPLADRERVFEEFVRLDAPTDGPGTGLGLTIVRGLTEANSGTVRYEDTPGGGATFVLALPTEALDDGRLP